MKVKEFNQLKKDVKGGNVEGLKKVISELTLKQAQALEDFMLDLELTDEMNKVLDEIVIHIDSLIHAEKVANKKAPAKKGKEAPETPAPEKPAKTEKVKPEKSAKPFDRVNVGDIVLFRVEGEEIEHEILIVYKGKSNIIGVMKEDEKEVFLIRKSDFNKQVFEWTDRHGEQYNIIVTL